MRIGLFTDAYFPAVSGVVTSVYNLKKELENLGHTVFLITMDVGYENNEKNVITFRGLPYPLKSVNQYRYKYISNRLVKKINELKLDIIHSHTEFSIGVLAHRTAHKFNIPYVYTYHTIYEDYMHYISKRFSDPLKKISRKISKILCERPDELVVPTKKVKELILTYGVQNNINIIPTGIDIEKFNKHNFDIESINSLKKEYNINEDDFVLLYIGRVAKEKSIDVLINQINSCLKDNQKIKLLVVGDGPDLNSLKRLVKTLNLNDKIKFTGEVQYKDIPIYYQLGDLFVNASITETQGLTYIEALASSLPMLVKFDINLSNVIIENVNGKFFYKDFEFCEKLNEILNNNELFLNMKANTLLTVSKFSNTEYAKNCEMLYNRLLQRKE